MALRFCAANWRPLNCCSRPCCRVRQRCFCAAPCWRAWSRCARRPAMARRSSWRICTRPCCGEVSSAPGSRSTIATSRSTPCSFSFSPRLQPKGCAAMRRARHRRRRWTTRVTRSSAFFACSSDCRSPPRCSSTTSATAPTLCWSRCSSDSSSPALLNFDSSFRVSTDCPSMSRAHGSSWAPSSCGPRTWPSIARARRSS